MAGESSPVPVESRRLLGMRVDATRYAETADAIALMARKGGGGFVCAASVHNTVQALDDPEFRRVMNAADRVTPDGMPLVWALRWLGVPDAQRVYGPSLTGVVCARAQAQDLPVAFLGGAPAVLDELLQKLRARYPRLRIVFSHSPPFRALTGEEECELVAEIEASGARILFVGLGCPKQERWMAEHRASLSCVMVGVGAAFDFLAGRKRQAPDWLQRHGLEWLFRLACEPQPSVAALSARKSPLRLPLCARALRRVARPGRAFVSAGTAEPGVPRLTLPRAQLFERVAVPALVVLLLVAGGIFTWAHPMDPVWDQKALLASSFGGEIVPSPARGFTSQLVVALQRVLSPWSGQQNEQVKLLAMLLYVAGATLLGASLLQRRALVALVPLFLFSSQYPFLWLSSELFVGAFLCFALTAWIRGRVRIAGVLLALLALCKPDLILVAAALGIYWAARSPSRRAALELGGAFALSLVVLLLPGLVLQGFDYFHDYNQRAGGRSFTSFSQHYAALIAPLQVLGQPPNPWSHSGLYTERIFPGAQTMFDVISRGFPHYVEFVALSCVRGAFRAIYVLNYALLALPLVIWGWCRGGFRFSPAEKSLGIAFVGLLPLVLLAFPHVRYFARFYPLVLILLFVALERLWTLEDRALRSRCLGVAGLCLATSLLTNTGRLLQSVVRIDGLEQYWFPD